MTNPSTATKELSDWDFCQESLEEVSRTFSQPIRMLPELQMRALTVGYLLCRVVDTIEDCEGVDGTQREDLYTRFQDVLRLKAPAYSLSSAFEGVVATPQELRLVNNLHRVMTVFEEQPAAMRIATVRWVLEMADGMRLYSRRAEGREFFAVMTLEDLERYCYFVAGTVGHLITDLFHEVEPMEARLREHAEAFGLGLQMVNIVKDVSDDFARGVSYMPRQMCRAEGFEPEELLEPGRREQAKRVVSKVVERARTHLHSALEYTIAIPPEHTQLRLFCLLPLWMAAETLSLVDQSDDVLVPGRKVKISREVVGRIILDCGRDCRDEQALRDSFALIIGPTSAL